MGKGKARTAIDRPTNMALARHKDEPTLCNQAVWRDENGNRKIVTAECGNPWWRHCNGNVFECAKLKYRYFASVKKK